MDVATGRGEIAGVCGFQAAPAECIAWTKKTSATPTARGNLLDNPVEDDVPITCGRSLLNSTPPGRGRCQTRCYKTRSKSLFCHSWHGSCGERW